MWRAAQTIAAENFAGKETSIKIDDICYEGAENTSEPEAYEKMGMMSVLRSRAGRKKSSWNCFFITAAVM